MSQAKKLSLKRKQGQCAHCVHCDKTKMRQGRAHCNSVYLPRNGHCGNFVQEGKGG